MICPLPPEWRFICCRATRAWRKWRQNARRYLGHQEWKKQKRVFLYLISLFWSSREWLFYLTLCNWVSGPFYLSSISMEWNSALVNLWHCWSKTKKEQNWLIGWQKWKIHIQHFRKINKMATVFRQNLISCFCLLLANVGTSSHQRTLLSSTRPGYPMKSPASSVRWMFYTQTWGCSRHFRVPVPTLSLCSQARSGSITKHDHDLQCIHESGQTASEVQL